MLIPSLGVPSLHKFNHCQINKKSFLYRTENLLTWQTPAFSLGPGVIKRLLVAISKALCVLPQKRVCGLCSVKLFVSVKNKSYLHWSDFLFSTGRANAFGKVLKSNKHAARHLIKNMGVRSACVSSMSKRHETKSTLFSCPARPPSLWVRVSTKFSTKLSVSLYFAFGHFACENPHDLKICK